MNLSDHLLLSARLFPEAEALWFEGRRFSFAELADASGRASEVLRSRGIHQGDRVALFLGNVPAWIIWYFATLRLGAISVTISTRLAPNEVDYLLQDSGASLLVHTPDAKAPQAEMSLRVSEDGDIVNDGALASFPDVGYCADLAPDTPGVILYTSGTTGFPKGAVLSHGNVSATVLSFHHLCGMSREDRLLLCVPLHHCYGQNALLNPAFYASATVILQRRFDPQETLQLIRQHQVTKLFAVPAVFQFLLEAAKPEDLAAVSYCFSAAAILPPRLSREWRERFGMPIFEGYGLTETAPFASYNHRLQYVEGSIGMPVDLVEMKVLNLATGDACAPDEPGEIAIRGPNVMLGYWNRPEETARVLRDGWFYTGDVGFVDPRGYFYLVDRLKDMISVGGMKVYPSEVERVLGEHAGVKDSAVIGLPDAVWGEAVAACVVPRPGMAVTPGALQAHARAHLAAFKVPGRVYFMDELPRNPAGKVLKTELRSRLSGPTESTSEPVAESPLLQLLRTTHRTGRRRALAGFLKDRAQEISRSSEAPGTEVPLLASGFDSMAAVSLSSLLQTMMPAGIKLTPTLVFDHPTIAALADHLLALLEEPLRTEDRQEGALKCVEGSIEQMTEEEALEALLLELRDDTKA
jgi:long-chain acyl-CoA synthetase